MSPKELAEAMETAFHRGDWDTLGNYLSDDFTYSLPGMTLGKDQVIMFGRLMLNAFPDRSYSVSNFEEEGNTVRATQQFRGTHTGTLDFSFMGMPPIPPTGKEVTLPEEHLTYTIENGKIKQIESIPTGETGMPAVLRQLGIPMPSGPQS